MMNDTDTKITVIPPICAAKGERHPKWVFWSVVANVSEDISRFAQFNEHLPSQVAK